MCNSRIKNNISILNIIGLVCIYILVTAIFPNLRIPFSILNEVNTDLFNHLVEALAVGYLSSVFIFYFTNTKRHQKERKRRIFEIYDLFNDMRDTVCFLEVEFGVRIDLWDCEYYAKYTDAMRKQFCEKLSICLENTTKYRNILTKQERNYINEIRKMYMSIEVYNGLMNSKEKTAHFNALKKVCELIDELMNNIKKELPYNASLK
jgi:hypothetical protein